MSSRDEVEAELERQWEDNYLPEINNLENPSVENPLDWYDRVSDKPLSQTLDKEVAEEVATMPMHVLYRVFPVRSQDIALVGHNPKDKTDELGTGSGELYELAEIEMDAAKIAEVTGPRIARYYHKKANYNKPLTDVVLDALRKYGHVDFDSLSNYFESDESDLPPVFDDIYITNLMKLPTAAGKGASHFETNFYEKIFWDELSLISPNVVFVEGKPAWKVIRKMGKEHSYKPIDDAPDTKSITEAHGHCYEIDDMNVIPVVHPGAYQNHPGGDGSFNDTYGEKRNLLEKTVSNL